MADLCVANDGHTSPESRTASGAGGGLGGRQQDTKVALFGLVSLFKVSDGSIHGYLSVLNSSSIHIQSQLNIKRNVQCVNIISDVHNVGIESGIPYCTCTRSDSALGRVLFSLCVHVTQLKLGRLPPSIAVGIFDLLMAHLLSHYKRHSFSEASSIVHLVVSHQGANIHVCSHIHIYSHCAHIPHRHPHPHTDTHTHTQTPAHTHRHPHTHTQTHLHTH